MEAWNEVNTLRHHVKITEYHNYSCKRKGACMYKKKTNQPCKKICLYITSCKMQYVPRLYNKSVRFRLCLVAKGLLISQWCVSKYSRVYYCVHLVNNTKYKIKNVKSLSSVINIWMKMHQNFRNARDESRNMVEQASTPSTRTIKLIRRNSSFSVMFVILSHLKDRSKSLKEDI